MTVPIRELVARQLLVQGPVYNFSGRAGTDLRIQCGYVGKPGPFSRAMYAMEVDGEIRREINATSCYGIELTDEGRKRYQHLLAEGETVVLDKLDLAIAEIVEEEAAAVVAPDPEPAPVATPDPEPAPAAVTPCPPEMVQLTYTELVEAVRSLLRTEQADLANNYAEVKAALAAARDEANRWRQKAKGWEEQVHRLERDKTELRNRLRVNNPKGERSRLSDVQDMLDTASRTEGVRVERTNNGHYLVYGTKGSPVSVPGTPSDYRSTANTRSELRKIGINV